MKAGVEPPKNNFSGHEGKGGEALNTQVLSLFLTLNCYFVCNG